MLKYAQICNYARYAYHFIHTRRRPFIRSILGRKLQIILPALHMQGQELSCAFEEVKYFDVSISALGDFFRGPCKDGLIKMRFLAVCNTIIVHCWLLQVDFSQHSTGENKEIWHVQRTTAATPQDNTHFFRWLMHSSLASVVEDAASQLKKTAGSVTVAGPGRMVASHLTGKQEAQPLNCIFQETKGNWTRWWRGNCWQQLSDLDWRNSYAW